MTHKEILEQTKSELDRLVSEAKRKLDDLIKENKPTLDQDIQELREKHPNLKFTITIEDNL